MSRLQLGLYDGTTLVKDITGIVRGASKSTNEHGDEAHRGTIDLSEAEAFRLYARLSALRVVLTWGGQAIWQGRLEDPELWAGPEGAGLALTALGFWRSLTDDRYTALWSSTSVAAFVETTAAMSATYDQSSRWGRDTNNRLYIELIKGNTYTLNKAAGLLFFAPHRGRRQIVAMQFQIAITLPTTMSLRIVGFDDSSPPGGALTNGIVYTSFVGTGALVNRAYSLNLTGNPRDIVGIDILCNTGATPAGETGANNIAITKLRVATTIANRVDTTLTANVTAGSNVTATVGSTAGMYVGMELVINTGATSSEIVTVESITSSTQFVADFVFNYTSGQTVRGLRITADEIVDDIVDQVATLSSDQLSSSTALIESPGLDLLNQSYEDAVPADILTRLAALGDTSQRRYEVGVIGQRLFFRPVAAQRTWYVYATRIRIKGSMNDLTNALYATYKDASGRTLRTADATDDESVIQHGLTRRSALAVETTSSAEAEALRDTALADRARPIPRVEIELEFLCDAHNAYWPLFVVRAGDTVVIRNLPPTLGSAIDRVRSFRVRREEYTFESGMLRLEPEGAYPALDVLISQQALR